MTSVLSAYQQMRRANLGQNRQFLAEYGLQQVSEPSSSVVVHEHPKETKGAKKSCVPKEKAPEVERRTSLRIRLKAHPDHFEDYESLKDSDEEDEYELLQNLRRPPKIPRPPRPNTYGSIEGVKVGTWWETRLECNYDGIHRPTVAGIHKGPDGAYSVALSGGYEDDVDLGDSFTYTGEGGRDLKGTANNPKNLRTAPQSKHQTLERGNLALSRNVETGNPVRVIRGYKLNSKFAPGKGYRYDGLYRVVRYWEAVGKAGYRIYKFDFQRCDPEPAPWHKGSPGKTKSSSDEESVSQKDGETIENTPTVTSEEKLGLPSSNETPLTPEKDKRKTICLELTPGKKTPVKVAHDLENLQNCSILCPDLGWHGWEDKFTLPNNDCLNIECEGIVEQVHCVGDVWSVVANPSPSLSPTILKNNFSGKEASLKASKCYYSPEASNRSMENVLSVKLEGNDEIVNEAWLGWAENSKPVKCDTLSIEYEGRVARVLLRDGNWHEIRE